VLLLAALVPSLAFAQKLVIVVRHAERADGGAGAGTGAMTAQTDPPLSEAGTARAQTLVKTLGDAGITAIYTTEYKRTQDTVKPLAAKLGLTPQTMPARDTAALAAKLKGAHAADVVLVAAHSNTVPAIIKAFGGPDVTVPDDQYDTIFIVVPATGALTKIKY
jgi:broad specificity phosphatase PhoE